MNDGKPVGCVSERERERDRDRDRDRERERDRDRERERDRDRERMGGCGRLYGFVRAHECVRACL